MTTSEQAEAAACPDPTPATLTVEAVRAIVAEVVSEAAQMATAMERTGSILTWPEHFVRALQKAGAK